MKPARNDRILFVLIAIAVGAFFLGRHIGVKESTDGGANDDSTVISGWQYGNRWDAPSRARKYYKVEERQAERFYFDPNTADSTQLLRLGLKPWQVRNIYKYRAKNGRFRRAEDFAKLYGLSVSDYNSLKPYIRISSDYADAATLFSENAPATAARDSIRRPVKLQAGERITLNNADTTMLKRIPGIGSGYAKAIVSYRKRLGGFANVNQLRDIEGLPEEALLYVELGNTDVLPLEVNRLTLNQLKHHPYINFYQARAIIEHRRLHGPIRSVSDMRLLNDFTENDIERLIPYLKF